MTSIANNELTRPKAELAIIATDELSEAERTDYLQRLWTEICSMPQPLRAAVLLGFSDEYDVGLDLFRAAGTASICQIANALEIDQEKTAELWNRLPLDDAAIAELLGISQTEAMRFRIEAWQRLVLIMEGPVIFRFQRLIVLAYNGGMKPLPDINLSELCRQVREEAKLTQQEMADLLGTAKSAVEKWEAGRHQPNGQCVAKILLIRDRIRAKAEKKRRSFSRQKISS